MQQLQKFIDHFQGLGILSQVTITLIGGSLILMSLTYIFCTLFKRSMYESMILKIGIVVRVLMFLGFTIEFYHQRYSAVTVGVWGHQEEVMTQFSSYLFFGYVFVVGIYDIYTIGQDKFRGFFHVFDITMISIPLIYTLTVLIYELHFEKEMLWAIPLVLSLFLTPYLLFKMYWDNNIKSKIIFFAVSIAQVSILSVLGITFLLYTAIFYLLVGTYEMARTLFRRIQVVSKRSFNKIIKAVGTVLSLLLISFSLFWTGAIPVDANTAYYVFNYYNSSIKFASLKEAEKAARTAVNDYKAPIKVVHGNTEDFENTYMLFLGDYLVEVDGITGKVVQVYLNVSKIKNSISRISKEKALEKSIQWLKSVGHNYDEKDSYVEAIEKNGQYIVSFYVKYNNGTIYKERTACQISWSLDGTLLSVMMGTPIFSLQDYKEIKIDRALLDKSISNFYEELEMKVPIYSFSQLDTFCAYSRKALTIDVISSNNDRISIDVNTGKVMAFRRNNKNLYLPEDKLGYYNADVNKLYYDKDLKVRKDDAIKIASKSYGIFGVYCSRAELIYKVDEEEKMQLKWMVVITPFKSQDHHIYFVDVNTGQVESLLDYGRGE